MTIVQGAHVSAAAKVMYHYAARLLQDATRPNLRVWAEHTKALLAALNALRLVPARDQWFPVAAGPVGEVLDPEGRVRRRPRIPPRTDRPELKGVHQQSVGRRGLQKRQARELGNTMDDSSQTSAAARSWAPAHPSVRELGDVHKEYTLAMAHLLLIGPHPHLQETSACGQRFVGWPPRQLR